MRRSNIFLFIFGLLAFISNTQAKDCLIISENNNILVEQGDNDKRYPPCSTFKIAMSLMGFDSGILVDETNPTWDYKPSYVSWLKNWELRSSTNTSRF